MMHPLDRKQLESLLVYVAGQIVGGDPKTIKILIQAPGRALRLEAGPGEVAAAASGLPLVAAAGPAPGDDLGPLFFSFEEAELVRAVGHDTLCGGAIARRLGQDDTTGRQRIILANLVARGVLDSGSRGYRLLDKGLLALAGGKPVEKQLENTLLYSQNGETPP